MAALTPAQQTSYADLINSGAAVPIGGVAPTPVPPPITLPNFSTGAIVTSPQNKLETGSFVAPTSSSFYEPTKLDRPTAWNITPEQTVSGQFDNVLNKDGLVMQKARIQGLQLGQSRGLLNSSMAVGAAQDSIIQNALTIASADANANLGANRLNTETANRFSETNAAAKTAANAFRATQLNNTEQFNATNKYNQSLSSFDANVRASIAQLDNQFKWDSETRKVALEIMSEAQKMKQKIMIDSGRDFNAATKQKMFTQVDKWVVSTARLTSLASKVPDMATLLKY